MARAWYGSLQNRLEENRQFCDKIKVGTGMTEYSYSDRHPYEVVEVIDQKHVKVRALDHKPIGEPMDNEWLLCSNTDNPIMLMTKRGKYWYNTVTITSDVLDEMDSTEDDNRRISLMLFLAHNDVDRDVLRAKGKVTRYHRMNVSFGVAEYYYDYEF